MADVADANEMIGGYRIKNQVGSAGQFSQVYEVIEPNSNRHFAMKVLLPEHADNSEHRRMLFHEADVGIKMRHENVINIIKVSKSEATPHFIMEYFPSGSLGGRLRSKDPRDKEFLKTQAKKIFKQVATGLAYMNASGYVHCDMKPDNILVNALGQAKIIDFAIAKKIIKPTFFSKMFRKKRRPMGTHSYMSPEQIKDDMLDGRADIYSYGITIYELAAGRPPFRGASKQEILGKHFLEKPASPIGYNADITDDFSAFVLKLLAKNPEDRPKTFHQVLIDLKKIKVFKSVHDEPEDDTY